MSKLKQAESSLENDATLREAYLFETPHKADRTQVMLIVALEQSQQGEARPNYEYFRARATMPGTAQFHKFGNCVSVTVCHHSKTVMFGPTSQIQMYPEGHGLGRALMARVIDWLHRNRMQTYDIQPGLLSSSTVNSNKERVRRNHFYMNFGFALNGTDSNHQPVQGLGVLNGHFTATTVGSLNASSEDLKRLIRCSDFYSKLGTERYDAQQNIWALQGLAAWARGSSWAAPLKRAVLFMMNSPIKKP
ncbi:GNAT family N-acetyltransferase [Stutzerimonas nitrititolerans]|uniref:GNAT family N-acetyltransferase n=1 Tax=Stutzerimonas nitrititolerans TaxID=2482751 RepID=UPI0011C07CB2|nr:GNAT family N-acetyltransferase [Stutzerimonas nitrititolerans]